MAAVNNDDWKTVKFLVVGDNISSPSPVDCDLSAVKQLTPFIKVCYMQSFRPKPDTSVLLLLRKRNLCFTIKV